jgi:antitoxin component of RelBE/YafQ-DinJ toxin-antitoxin module
MSKAVRAYSNTGTSLREQAEVVLLKQGIPMENAVEQFYRQVIMKNGMPFNIENPSPPLDVSKMSKEELDAELEKGEESIKAGRIIPAAQVRERLQRKFAK